ncbi:unnamed protein product [Clonostachys byssicola]|uniref:Uncharacterized protein n=1 Tax=Clonostachys byssicola TaxID=160290 RepID=A0A9N9U2E0_9HYPO|nr:unnamed protein product [Clonostachys byssicola]
MRVPRVSSLAYAWCIATSLPVASAFQEAIAAEQLLGSHFGVPGLPGAYDYVILGGGTAGITLAHRLASDGRYTVALVNAGDFAEFANGNFSEVPALASMFGGSNPFLKNPQLDFDQYTTKQSQLDDRALYYTIPKVLGGASSRNYLWFPRAHEGALAKWAELVGDESYLFPNFLRYYLKVGSFTPPNTKTRFANASTPYDAAAFAKGGGLVQVGYPNWANPISSWLEKGFEGIGLKPLAGALADGKIFGYAYPPSSMDSKTQSRSSSSTSYLRDALVKTTNLNIYKDTLAKKILFDGKKAVGATVESGGVEYQLTANKEVIVSAGFARSPQLLMVSGIGPHATLNGLGIDTVADLPGVGQNMMDHIVMSPSYAVNVLTHNSFSDAAVYVDHLIQYRQSLTGMFTNNGGDVLAFTKFDDDAISQSTRADIDKFSTDWPHVQFMPLDAYVGNFEDSMAAPAGNYVSPMVALPAPFSRGNVTIASADTKQNPVISPNWLLDPRDQEMAVAAFKLSRKVMTQNATSPVVIGDEVFPGLDVATDEQILAAIRKQAFPVSHGSCTCAMGPSTNEMAVVDTSAKVHGVEALRVVDASIFPVLPPGTPSQTIYALAEKIADDILNGPSRSPEDTYSSSRQERNSKDSKDEL